MCVTGLGTVISTITIVIEKMYFGNPVSHSPEKYDTKEKVRNNKIPFVMCLTEEPESNTNFSESCDVFRVHEQANLILSPSLSWRRKGGREKLLKRELKLRAAEETETIRKFKVL